MYEKLQKNWKINHNHNQTIFQNVKLDVSYENYPDGRSVLDIAAHLVNNKSNWLNNMTPKTELVSVEITDRESLVEAETNTSEAIASFIEIEKNGELVKGFKSDLVGFIFYLIAHDAHHRGQILQILKITGSQIDPKIQYGIWDW